MQTDNAPMRIIVADDDPDDRIFIGEAFAEAKLQAEISYAKDGEELMQYLRRTGAFEHLKGETLPNIILLDLNMPEMDGYEVLSELKSDPDLKRIPVIVLTTSKAEEDILGTYDLGVNSFITKPVSFEGLKSIANTIGKYWFETVSLPGED